MENKHNTILTLKTLKKNIEPPHSFTGSYKNGVGYWINFKSCIIPIIKRYNVKEIVAKTVQYANNH